MENASIPPDNPQPETAIGLLETADLPEADRIMRLAFGTYLGLPDPMLFLGEGDYVRTRRKSNPEAAFGIKVNGSLKGSNFVTNWGSIGFFGPLTIHPEYWDKGLAKKLLEPALACFEKWGTRQYGLFTFPASTKHVGLYQQFGFWPHFLTAILTKPVGTAVPRCNWTVFSDYPPEDQAGLLKSCRELTDRVYPGLDVSGEIKSVQDQSLGDTLLVWDRDQLKGFALCHYGPGTEAAAGACYLKFGIVSSGSDAPESFSDLLAAAEKMSAGLGLSRVVAGVNTARHRAYVQLLGSGFRTSMQGVLMQRPGERGYNHPDNFILDDWR